jgi:hypothetical protein
MKATNNLIVVSDLHAGCRMGLHPKSPSRLDGGGQYVPSAFQLKMLAWWDEFWKEWVPSVTKREPFDLVVNGDVLDGVHHRSTTQVSQNLDDQVRIAESLLAPVVERVLSKGGQYMHVRGTEAHVGQSGEFEERVARSLGAKPNAEGQHARFDLWKLVGQGKKSALVHLLHHVGTTGSAAHESSAVNAELTAMYVEAARWRREPPDYIVRSHRHRFIAVDVATANGYGAAIVTPAWQGKTPFTWKIPGARVSEPQIGGVLIRAGSEEHHFRRFVRSFDRSPVEE